MEQTFSKISAIENDYNSGFITKKKALNQILDVTQVELQSLVIHEIKVEIMELSLSFILKGIYTFNEKKKSTFTDVNIFLENNFDEEGSDMTNILNDAFIDDLINEGIKQLDIHAN